MATTIFDQRGQRVENQVTVLSESENRIRHYRNRLTEIVAVLEKQMQCNCDLDNWGPEVSTGHSWVCRIHKEAFRLLGTEFGCK